MDHTLMHFEIPANNVEKLKRFYEEVFGWKIVQASGPIEYWVIQTVPLTLTACCYALVSTEACTKKQVPESKPLNYFAVESISDFLAKIEKLGGRVTQPKQEVPEIVWIAAAEDPEGNLFALIQPIRV
jgi:predicted enzyme related to lactoylglutathione lyase